MKFTESLDMKDLVKGKDEEGNEKFVYPVPVATEEIFDALTTAAKTRYKDGEDPEEFTKRVLNKVGKLYDDEWGEIDDLAQSWFNAAETSRADHKEIPLLFEPDEVEEEAEAEEPAEESDEEESEEMETQTEEAPRGRKAPPKKAPAKAKEPVKAKAAKEAKPAAKAKNGVSRGRPTKFGIRAARELWNDLVPQAKKAGVEGIKTSASWPSREYATERLEYLRDGFKKAKAKVPAELTEAISALH